MNKVVNKLMDRFGLPVGVSAKDTEALKIIWAYRDEEEKRKKWKPPSKRKFVEIAMEMEDYEEEVDENQAKVVRWLQKLGAYVLHASLGEGKGPEYYMYTPPQVQWMATDNYDMNMAIFIPVKDYIWEHPNLPHFKVDVNAFVIDGMLRFNMMWYDEVSMLDFIKWMEDKGKM